MGLLFVLIFYAAALTFAASVAAVLLGFAAHFLTRGSPKRKRAILFPALFPYACIGFAAVWFVAYAVLNSAVFHRDPGLGDSWETPLPNGYSLWRIDTADQGTVYNPKTQSIKGVVGGQEDAVFGVRQLQVANQLIFGASDSGYLNRIGQDSKFVDTCFELNTANGNRMEFDSLEQLRQKAASQGIELHLREFQSVFSDYRTTWFDYLAGAVLFFVPLAAFLALCRLVWRVRALRLASEPAG